MEPGTKIAIISKSGDHTHVAPSEPPTSKSVAAKKEKPDEENAKAKAPTQEKPKSEDVAPKDKPKPPSPSAKTSPSEPQLPPKERERRVSKVFSSKIILEGFFHFEYVMIELLP